MIRSGDPGGWFGEDSDNLGRLASSFSASVSLSLSRVMHSFSSNGLFTGLLHWRVGANGDGRLFDALAPSESESSINSVTLLSLFMPAKLLIDAHSSFLGGNGSQVPSLWRTISCSSGGRRVLFNSSLKNPSIMRFFTRAGLLHTGHVHFGLFSFICRYSLASKVCRWSHVVERHGTLMRIFPSGQARETLHAVVAISWSWSFNLSLK